jgi:hypothetical protein
MQAETPARGILKRNDWGDSQLYQVACECADSEHDHHVWVESDDTNRVTVTIYTTVKSNWWDTSRWQLIWRLLTRGYVKYEATVVLTQQQALNYAATLEQAVADLTQKD